MNVVERHPMAFGPYVAVASSFVWIPALVFTFVGVAARVSAGAELIILLFAGICLLVTSAAVIRSGRKSRWVFALLGGIALAVDGFLIVALLSFSGGIYH